MIASAVKYVWRYKYKNGIEDLKKAKVFLEKAIKEEQEGNIHHSGKFYLVVPGEVKDFSHKQYLFIRFASQSTGKTDYITCCEDMIGLVDDMSKEMEELNK